MSKSLLKLIVNEGNDQRQTHHQTKYVFRPFDQERYLGRLLDLPQKSKTSIKLNPNLSLFNEQCILSDSVDDAKIFSRDSKSRQASKYDTPQRKTLSKSVFFNTNTVHFDSSKDLNMAGFQKRVIFPQYKKETHRRCKIRSIISVKNLSSVPSVGYYEPKITQSDKGPTMRRSLEKNKKMNCSQDNIQYPLVKVDSQPRLQDEFVQMYAQIMRTIRQVSQQQIKTNPPLPLEQQLHLNNIERFGSATQQMLRKYNLPIAERFKQRRILTKHI